MKSIKKWDGESIRERELVTEKTVLFCLKCIGIAVGVVWISKVVVWWLCR